MADNIKDNVVMSEAEKQEKAIRDEYNARKRRRRIKKLARDSAKKKRKSIQRVSSP